MGGIADSNEPPINDRQEKIPSITIGMYPVQLLPSQKETWHSNSQSWHQYTNRGINGFSQSQYSNLQRQQLTYQRMRRFELAMRFPLATAVKSI